MFGRAGVVHVLEDVAAAVHARTLAVPHGEHAVVLGLADQVDLLRAPDGRRGQVFVDAGDELHVVCLQMRFGLPQVFVEAAQRRAAVAGDEAGGVQTGGDVALALHASLVDVAAAVAVVSVMVSPLVSDRVRAWERWISAPDPDQGPLFERHCKYFRLKNLRSAQCRPELTYTEIRNADGGIRKSDGASPMAVIAEI